MDCWLDSHLVISLRQIHNAPSHIFLEGIMLSFSATMVYLVSLITMGSCQLTLKTSKRIIAALTQNSILYLSVPNSWLIPKFLINST